MGRARGRSGVKTKAKSVEECTTLFEIEVSKETIDKAFEDIYAKISKIANIPGFRAGKAPKELVKKYYSKEAKKEVLDHVIPDAYQKAVWEHKIEPIDYPEITDLIFEEGKMMTFKAMVDTRPKFKLKNYKGIQIDKKKAAVKDEDINKALENLREYNAKYAAAGDRPIQLNDYVVSDLDCIVDGKSAHKKRENLWLYVDKESLMSGLTEKMIGMKKGEERDIEVALPEKYPDKTLAGKIAKYHVNVKDIKERRLPSVDDEFAKDLGKENLEQLKKEIAETLEKKMTSDSEIDMENQLLDKLIDENSFAVPSNLIKKQVHLMTENAKAKLREKGFKKEEIDKKDDEFAARFKDEAARRVRLMFILNRIAADERIEADDKDMENAYKTISIQTGRNEKEIKDYYEKEALKYSLLERVREEKTIEFLLKNADIKEKG